MSLPHPRLTALRIQQIEYAPRELEHGVLYVSKRFQTCLHLCACGCGMKTVTPQHPTKGWILTGSDEVVTLRPSILNKREVCPSAAHYYVTENRIDWL